MTWDEYASAWSRLHGGFDPRTGSVFVRGWVRLAFTLGSPVSRRVGPTVVTMAGLVLCVLVPFAGLIPGAALVLLGALADTLDGAVAVLTGRATRLGYVLDSVADRIGEAAWLAAFWVGGAQGWVVVAAGAASWLHEYARARATAAGMTEIGAVTVGERPTRVLIALFGLLAAGVSGHAPLALTVAAAVWLALAVIGLAQLAVAIRRAID
ncbi:CDP-alcohol phosphatidyltransferase family protein [Actinoplanes sp. NPDC051411]|uniref:CDP-alcohol phosphatidyltransferase family protein n=1 Tax=Actinoplanes sp. NPDC051411 TaxID=3155522 RepID=UPI00344395AB